MSNESTHEYNLPLLRQLRKIIGSNIRTHRYKRQMLISELAKTAGISETFLDYYEMGKYEIRLEELLRIACCLKVEVKDLM